MGVRLPDCKGITKGVGTLPRNSVECANIRVPVEDVAGKVRTDEASPSGDQQVFHSTIPLPANSPPGLAYRPLA